MKDYIEERCKELGTFMISHQCTVRQVEAATGILKSTVHRDVTKWLKICDYGLYVEVRKLLDKNKAERHLRGGEATRRKYGK